MPHMGWPRHKNLVKTCKISHLQAFLKIIASNAMLFWLPIIVSSLIDGMPVADVPIVTSTPGHGRLFLSHVLLGAKGSKGNSSTSSGSSISHSMAPMPSVVLTADSNSVALSHSAAKGHGRGGASMPVMLSSIPFIVTAIASIWLGRSSQAMGERTMHLTIPYLVAGLLFAGKPITNGTV